ncbi:MAG: DMT family transporter [Pirellulales bacterium]|nr:DMT family transporter [Pirellulales bacterium]
MNTRYGIGFAILSILSWSGGNLLLRATLDRWPVGLAGIFSRVITVSVLAAWLLSRRQGRRDLLPRGTGRWLLLMGAVSIGINLLWFSAMKCTNATNVSLLFRLDLVFVVLLGGLLGLERIRPIILPVLAFMLVGLALFSKVHLMEWSGQLQGDLMMVAAAFGFAVNAFVIRHILRKMAEEAVALYNHMMSATGFLALAWFSGEFSTADLASRPATDWLWPLCLGAVFSLSLPLYYAALRRLEVWRLRAFMLSAPLLVAAAEASIWGLDFTLAQCLGALMVLAGLGLCIRIESRAAVSPTPPLPEPIPPHHTPALDGSSSDGNGRPRPSASRSVPLEAQAEEL